MTARTRKKILELFEALKKSVSATKKPHVEKNPPKPPKRGRR